MSEGPFYEFEGMRPRIAPDAFVAPNAAIIGDVEIGAQSSVWFGCTLRGDFNHIRIGARTNIQDNSVLHINALTFPCIVGDDVTIGHSALVHACTIENHGFVGMAATVLDGAVIEEGGMLAAHALLGPGKRIGRGELWAGVPAKFVRMLSDEDRVNYAVLAERYVEYGQRFRQGLKPIE
jgi:carbonic anhydrase/acetyltransferase-like protein (isoleucine patch superfamily)